MTSPTSRPDGRTRLSATRRRAQLLDAGQHLFGQRPYAEVSLADISERAGVSRPLIQHYFGNKRALYLAVFERAFEQMRDTLIPDSATLDPVEARRMMRAYFDFCASHPAGALVAAGAAVGGASEIGVMVEAFIGDVTASILDKLPGDARTPELRAALSAWSYGNIGMTLQLARDPSLSPDWAAGHSVRMLLATIAPEG